MVSKRERGEDVHFKGNSNIPERLLDNYTSGLETHRSCSNYHCKMLSSPHSMGFVIFPRLL